jgi:hydroxyacylglutathione hydrolase
VLQGDGEPVVLDVRRNQERAIARIDGSLHIPIHEVLERIDEIPTAHTIWVHCAAGYRAGIVAALLAAKGRAVVAVDDDFASARALGISTTDQKDVA